MYNKELIDGIAKHIKAGDSKDVIQHEALNAGYSRAEFEDAFNAAQRQTGNDSAGSSRSMSKQQVDATGTVGGGLPEQKRSNIWIFVIIGTILLIVVLAGAFVFWQQLQERQEARENARDALQELNLNLLRPEAELYFDTNGRSYIGFCDTVDNENVDCEATETWYRLGVTTNDNSYRCVDSSGFSGVVDSRPETSGCEKDIDGKTQVESPQKDVSEETSSSVSEPSAENNNGRVLEISALSAANNTKSDEEIKETLYDFHLVDRALVVSSVDDLSNICKLVEDRFANKGFQYYCKAQNDEYRVLVPRSDGSYTCLDSSAWHTVTLEDLPSEGGCD